MLGWARIGRVRLRLPRGGRRTPLTLTRMLATLTSGGSIPLPPAATRPFAIRRARREALA
jgi:hypothetical protein